VARADSTYIAIGRKPLQRRTPLGDSLARNLPIAEDTMNTTMRPRGIREQDLEDLNARAEAALTYDDDAWDDAVRAAEADCASLCESLLVDVRGDFE
jgi:hypothetical protein